MLRLSVVYAMVVAVLITAPSDMGFEARGKMFAAAQQRSTPAKVVPARWGCTTSEPPNIEMRATIFDNGNSVKSDGMGDYVETVNLINAFALRTGNRSGAKPKTIRGLSVDLDRPVAGGGGAPRGVWFDTTAVFNSFWYFDANEHVYALTEIPLGTTVDSERTQLWITSPMDGRRYVLHFGPWANKCEPYGPIVTKGSTKVRITRTGTNSYTFHAPAGSVATLSDVNDNNQQTPVYQGLFYVTFLINASPK